MDSSGGLSESTVRKFKCSEALTTLESKVDVTGVSTARGEGGGLPLLSPRTSLSLLP